MLAFKTGSGHNRYMPSLQMDINTYVYFLSFKINFVTLCHGRIVGYVIFLSHTTNIINQLYALLFFLQKIIGRGAPCGKGRDHPSRRAHSKVYANIVTTVYAFDRIVSLKETSEPFVMPKNFSAENIFKDCYGIICGTQTKAERIRIRAYYPLVNYLRTLPWHASQKEVHTTDEYSEFEFFLRPTFDFRQEILSQGNEIEVMEPASFRQEVMEALQSTMRRYQP